MNQDRFELLLHGRQETDSIEFKGPMHWSAKTFVKDILAMSNVVDGGVIIVGVTDKKFDCVGLTNEEIESFDIDIMRDQIAPFADPRVVFSIDVKADASNKRYALIEVAPFDEIPVVCAKDGHDVNRGVVYFRSRSQRPASARIGNSSDFREVIETAISRRSRALKRAGFIADSADSYDFDAELGGL